MTPLAMRYLDYLGAGEQLRNNSIALNTGVDAISLRLGWRLGNVWGGVGARRTARFELARSLHDVINRQHSNSVEIQWGKRVTDISEGNDQVQLKFEDQSVLQADILLGCDGIHSAARHLWVEPEREKEYSGRAVSMGWADYAANKGKEAPSIPITLPGGQPALRDTAAFNATGGVLISSFFEPTRQHIFFAHVRKMAEQNTADRDGWQLLGKDQEAARKEVMDTYSGGRVDGLQDTIAKCESWQIYPIYSLPPRGRWHKGRVLLLGDAAHAVSTVPASECPSQWVLTDYLQMPPQGESTGIAIEDGVLVAEVLRRRAARPVSQLFSDFESVRRKAIDKHYQDAEKMGKLITSKPSGVMGVIMDLVMMVFMWVKSRQQIDHFKGDVRDIELPA